ncbi:MAG TPA: 3-phosphoserine/phosphohydroxythreonine transaminase [Xanthomonadaceae bacterium]|jgi:phosphoserine aminotransferase|nr:3-phosphoserine/phosphohydroxythreonine transaminase [Xanthomonadaceae bacterium]
MSRGYNFSAGPSTMPEPVLRRAQAEMLEWSGERASVMEVSHRGKAFVAMTEKLEADLRRLLGVPSDYAVLFLQGGATQHFAQIPMNIAGPDDTADYLVTGHWSSKALSEAKTVVRTNVAATAEAGNFTTVPDRTEWKLTPGAAYLHVTPNETIQGVEFEDEELAGVPGAADVPVVADMSSNILSRPVDVSRYGIIYAGAQKNMGAAGLTLLVVRNDLLARKGRPLPNILTYAAHAKEKSLLNTPPSFPFYVTGLALEWIEGEGGVAVMAQRNRAKADMLYAAVDGSNGYYRNPVDLRYRSRMNVPFTLHDAALDGAFLKESEAAGLLALKGHKAVGGMRASIYNAMPIEGVKALVEFMAGFQTRHG